MVYLKLAEFEPFTLPMQPSSLSGNLTPLPASQHGPSMPFIPLGHGQDFLEGANVPTPGQPFLSPPPSLSTTEQQCASIRPTLDPRFL